MDYLSGVSEDCPAEEIFALLHDDYARAILLATSTRPMSASTLSEECDFSVTTVYRRVDRLVDCGLLRERTQVADDGHHYSVYEARVDHLDVDVDDGELSVSMETTTAEDPADRFTEMWEGI